MRKVFPAIIALSCLALAVGAGVPGTISYQGRLIDDSGLPVTGSVEINFKIYGSSSGTDSLWTSGFVSIDVESGLFQYELGSNGPLPAGLFSGNDPRFLGITVGSDAEIIPRTRLVSVPYAHRAASADTADYAYSSPGGVSNGWVDDGSVVHTQTGSDNVGIGTSTPTDKLVVGGNLGTSIDDNFIVVRNGNDTYSGYRLGYNNDNFGWMRWFSYDGSISFGTRQTGTNYLNTLILNMGNVGMGVLEPSENLVVGKDLGSYSGNRIVVGAEAPAAYAGFIMGEDADNRAFLTWSVDNNYFDIGIEDEGTQWSQMIKLQDGETKIGVGSGDASVQLPNDAVSSAEILNEAGLRSVQRTTDIYIQADWTTLLSTSVNFPASGYAVVIATGELYTYSDDSGVWPMLEFGIADHTGVAPHAYSVAYRASSENYRDVYDAVTIHEVFSVSTGTTDFTFLAKLQTGPADNSKIRDGRMTVIYIPTSYGAKAGDASADATDQPNMVAQPQVFTSGSTFADEMDNSESGLDPIASLRAEFEGELQALRDEIAELKKKQ